MAINISQSKLQSGDVLEHLRFVYYSDPQAFINTFNRVGITFIKSDKDLITLANLINSGNDKSGFVKDSNGNPIKFDGMYIALNKVPISNQSVKNAGIKITT